MNKKKLLIILAFTVGLLLIVAVLTLGYRDLPVSELKEKYATAPSAFLKMQSMEVHYRDEGNASDSLPIVLIHGTGSSLHTFNGWVEQLTPARRVIRMDIPGYGLTGPFPNRNYSIAHYTEFLDAFLAKLEIKKCILGGNSLGGRIAWSFAASNPKKVDRLILIDATGYPSKSESEPLAFSMAKSPIFKHLLTFITPKFIARKSVKNVYADQSKVTESLTDRYFELTLREGNRQAFIDRFEAKNPADDYLRIQTIQKPTLILWGEEDRLIPVESAYRFQQDLPNNTLVILPDLGHVPMEEDATTSLIPVQAFINP